MPPRKKPENVLPPQVEALKRLRRTPQKPKPRKLYPRKPGDPPVREPEERKPIPPQDAEAIRKAKRAVADRKSKVGYASNPDGTCIPVKDRKAGPRLRGNENSKGRPFKKGKEWKGWKGGASPKMSLTWFRDFMTKPVTEILDKPLSEMSAFEATVQEALRLALDHRGEEAVIRAIQDVSEDLEGGLPVSVKRGLERVLEGDGGSIARLLPTPDDRMKAIKHLHAYQMGNASSTMNLQNNGGSFEPPAGDGEPEKIEVVLVTPEGEKQKLQRLDQMPPHPDAGEAGEDAPSKD